MLQVSIIPVFAVKVSLTLKNAKVVIFTMCKNTVDSVFVRFLNTVRITDKDNHSRVDNVPVRSLWDFRVDHCGECGLVPLV